MINDKNYSEEDRSESIADHGRPSNRSGNGAFVVIDVDRLDGNYDGKDLLYYAKSIHFVLTCCPFNPSQHDKFVVKIVSRLGIADHHLFVA